MKKIIVIVGPTSIGKTKLSIELAKLYNGEVINADSLQVYKGLNIGTAKITEQEKEHIPHHLFDIKEVTEDYSIYEYQKDCRTCIADILKRNKTCIIVGGTGLYIKSALYDYQLDQTVTNDYPEYSTEELYNKLISLDKDCCIAKQNRRRIINALNYYLSTGTSISNNKTTKLLYECVFIGLTTERQTLYERINQRVDQMVANGLIAEAKYFYDQNYRTKPLISGIGYKELYNYFDGLCSKEEAIEAIKKNSRHYAKRQYTFFNNQLDIKWFETDFSNFHNTVNEVTKYLSTTN